MHGGIRLPLNMWSKPIVSSMNCDSVVKGNPNRIALIHAFYALAWTAVAAAAGLQPIAAALIFAIVAVLVVAAVVNFRRAGAKRGDTDAGIVARIARINIVTAAAAAVAAALCHVAGLDGWILCAVLAVMAAHFLPLWKLLNRRSLLLMAMALFCIAAAAAIAPAYAAPSAAIVFALNSARLIQRSP